MTLRILVTNDDGIHAPGLAALARVAAEFGEVSVVAPHRQNSGMSHALTLFKPLAVEEVEGPLGAPAWAVHGTPVDCVKLAFAALLPERPELVLSGINNGQNVGMNAFYSATVAAALEGLWQGASSVAFSRGFAADGGEGSFTLAAEVVRRLLGRLAGLKGEALSVSVNVPCVEESEIRGLALTRTSTGGIRERYEEITGDEEGNSPRRSATGAEAPTYRLFRLLGDWQRSCDDLGSDDYAFEHNYITVSPLGLERTPPAHLDILRRAIDGADLWGRPSRHGD